jgi:aminomethyltransferase
VTVSRTGFTGDLGYELWVGAADALSVWDALWERAQGYGVQPFGLAALRMLRIEAGMLMLDADFDSSRYAWNDAHRSTPIELGWGWMFRGLEGDDRAFIGRSALERELAERTSRWALRGLVVDWGDFDRVYTEAGLVPPKDHAAVVEDRMVYDDERRHVGYARSFMYSPLLQRHIALARVRPDLAEPGTRVKLEFIVDHHYEQVAAHVTRLPLFNPERKTA